jgi:hypothetical protein
MSSSTDDTLADETGDTHAAPSADRTGERVKVELPLQRASATELGKRYELGGVIGRGGMGEVRLARDTRIGREVAVKLMRGTEHDSVNITRFFREARVQGVLEHPSVVPVHDLGIDANGAPYFVMKRLAGVTLAQVLTPDDSPAKARWPRRQLLARFVDICLAIDFAHVRGVIHRDLKPANIMLGDYGEAYVLDWGLARLSADGDSLEGVSSLSGDDGQTQAGALLGTPGYMSPEQARGESVDRATDVFALGMVLFEILAGVSALPRGMAAITETLSAKNHRPSARVADVPLELDDLCARASATKREDRPSARELANGVQAYLDGDRDLARRREVAEEHAQRAETALATIVDGSATNMDDARALAMREAGRALALDPSSTRAATVLGGLLIDAPDAIPAEAIAAADLDRGEVRQKSIRRAAWTYWIATVAMTTLFIAPLRHIWPVFFGMGAAIVTGTYAWFLSKKPMPMVSPYFYGFMMTNNLAIASVGLVFGTLLMMPIFLVGSLAAFLSQPSHHRPITIILFHAIPFVVMLGLEVVGVLPPSFYIENKNLVIAPYTMDVTPMSLVVMLALGYAIQVGSSADVQISFRRHQQKAQDRLHAQTWHLEQLLPELKKRRPRG